MTVLCAQGVVQQTVKEVNQSLVDDFLVLTDKIGAANFYWSFPSKAYQDQIHFRESFDASQQALRQAVSETQQAIAEASAVRKADGREEKLRRLAALQAEEKEIDRQLEALKFNDPEEIKRIIREAEANQQAANRWTDNIWAVKSFLTRKKGMSSKEVRCSLCANPRSLFTLLCIIRWTNCCASRVPSTTLHFDCVVRYQFLVPVIICVVMLKHFPWLLKLWKPSVSL